MASFYKRLMDTRTLAASLKQPPQEVADLGAYTKLEVQPRVVKAGTAGNLLLKHAAVNEDEAFVTLATISLSAASNTPLSLANFLRFVRWETSGDVAGDPIALVDVVAKQG